MLVEYPVPMLCGVGDVQLDTLDLQGSPNPEIVRDRRQFPSIPSSEKEPGSLGGEPLGGFGRDRRRRADDQDAFWLRTS